jgi:para-aminobenzoate synthetase / 4-amino-4-deoxychorismate lyase
MLVLLDNSAGEGPPSHLFTEPVDIVCATEPGEVAGALKRLETALSAGLHAAGYFSYELGYVLEPRLSRYLPGGRRLPLLQLGLYETRTPIGEGEISSLLASQAEEPAYRLSSLAADWSEATYTEAFVEAHEKILAGDIYQLNLTFKSRFQLHGSPFSLYADLRRRQPVFYGALIKTEAATILSLSPELFITRVARRILTRPMKGTAPRGATPEADAQERQGLAADVKQRAENLMIVDLMRNDLGRVAEIGSVAVPDLFTVETYRTLHQMTSTIEARLREDLTVADLLRAIFPPGSVTGAPKIRAMELISEYEPHPRGVYCGAIGYLAPDQSARLNVAIRTPVVFADGTGEIGIGSGVVADSHASKEYAECLLKMKFLEALVSPSS